MDAFVVFIKRPVFATMVSTFLVVMGLLSYFGLGVDAMPNVDLPIVNVATTLRGASPAEIETQVTKPLEEAVNTVGGIDELRSYSMEGASYIPITFVLEKSAAEAVQDVRERVSMAMRELPNGTDPPVVIKFDVDQWPVAGVAIYGARSLRTLREIAEKTVKPYLEAIDGVGQVAVLGGWKRAINIVLDSEKLRSFGLSVNQVATAFRNQHIEVPGGRIVRGELEFGLKTMARARTVEEFDALVVATKDGRQITLRDIGRARDTYEDPRSLSRAWRRSAGDQTRPSVILMVRKQTGTNTVSIVDKVFERMKSIRKALPADVGLEMAWEQGRFIKASIEEVKFHLVLGAVLASLVCLLFIRDWRATLIAALAIPTSIISTFALIKAMGFTINNMTMLALTLSVGVVIDDAIVVLENIYRQMEEEGKPPVQAAIDGLKEIALAVLATTFSLVVIFLPVAFMSGRIGMWFNSYGVTVAFAILISLVVSFTLTPMLCSRFLKVQKRKKNHFYDLLDRIWGRLLRWALVHRWKTVLIGVGLFATTFPLFGMLKKDIAPRDDRNKFQVRVDLPEGSSLTYADEIMRKVEKDIRSLPEVIRYFTVIGDRGRGVEDVTSARMWVSIVPLEKRDYKLKDVLKKARKFKRKYPGVKIAVIELGWGSAYPINLDIRGPNLDKLYDIAGMVMDKMRKVPGYADVDSSLTKRSPEVQVDIRRATASDHEVRIAETALSLRALVGGVRIGRFLEDADLYDIWLRVRRPDRSSYAALGHLPIGSQRGGTIELRQIANLRSARGPQQIVRLNRTRTVTVMANLEGIDMGKGMGALMGIIKSLDLPEGYKAEFGGRGKMMKEMMSNLGIAFGLAFLFMYMILAAQFESFLHPITILLSLPLSLPCALFSLWILDTSFNIYSALGLFMLFGIVKKNGILQIDYTNTLRSRGMRTREAILTANHTRFRPILMTTLTLIVGMIPIALGTGPGSAARSAMAKVIIGGQALSLVISLLIVPVTYSIFEDVGARLRYHMARGFRSLMGYFAAGVPFPDHCDKCYAVTNGQLPLCETCGQETGVFAATLKRLRGKRNLILTVGAVGLLLTGWTVFDAIRPKMPSFGKGKGGMAAMMRGKGKGKGGAAAMMGGKRPQALAGKAAGKAAAGKAAAGKAPAGKAPAGKAAAGKAPAGKAAVGKALAGKAAAGKALAGKGKGPGGMAFAAAMGKEPPWMKWKKLTPRHQALLGAGAGFFIAFFVLWMVARRRMALAGWISLALVVLFHVVVAVVQGAKPPTSQMFAALVGLALAARVIGAARGLAAAPPPVQGSGPREPSIPEPTEKAPA